VFENTHFLEVTKKKSSSCATPVVILNCLAGQETAEIFLYES